MHPPPRGLFVTGTDTGVGKTVASAALLHRLHAAGLRAVGMMPVASGCERTADCWRNDDALRLQAASDPRPAYDDINPYALEAATAPQLAARAMGVRVELAPLMDAYARLSAQCGAVVVEGVGGWAAPLGDGLDQCELPRALALPVVLVVGLRLGCLNHALLTAEAVRARGLRLAGWVANRIDSTMSSVEDNIATLSARLDAPMWADVPRMPSPHPDQVIWRQGAGQP